MRTSRLFFILLIFVFATSLFSQNLSIQGVARDNSGQSLTDATYGFTFRLYTDDTGGSFVWQETQTLDVLNGVFSAVLGSISDMSNLDFNTQYWLSLEIDNNGEMSPRTKLTLSPYAIMAGLSGTTNVFPQSGNVGIGTTSPNAPLHVIGDLQLSNSNIPIGLTSQIDGNTPILNFDVNFAHANRNTDYLGAALRIDSRGDDYQLFQWLGRPAGNTSWGSLLMTLKANGDLWVANRLSVSSDFGVGRNVGVAGYLNVDGNIIAGGEHIAVAPGTSHGTRIVHGRIAAGGNIEKGHGFTCSRQGIGNYSIHFNTRFADHPTITATAFGADGADNIVSIHDVGYQGVIILIRDRGNTDTYGEDCCFLFIAVGDKQ